MSSIQTATSPATVMMTADEAERTHRRIVARDKMQATDLQKMFAFEGWKALGHVSWQEYLGQAFDYSESYLSRISSRVQINHELGAGDIPERQTRVLKKLKSSDDRKQAYDTAKNLAQAEDSTVAVRHVEMAVKKKQTENEIASSRHRVVSVMLDGGELSLVQARQMVDELDKLDDVTYAKVITIVASHTVTAPALIPEFADMVNRSSRTLDRILRTGHINERRIRDAGLADLHEEKRLSQNEIIGEKVEKKRQVAIEQGKVAVIPHIITVYEGDPQKTLRELKKVLPVGDLTQIREMLGTVHLK